MGQQARCYMRSRAPIDMPSCSGELASPCARHNRRVLDTRLCSTRTEALKFAFMLFTPPITTPSPQSFRGRYLGIFRVEDGVDGLPGSVKDPLPATPHPRPLRDNPKYLPLKVPPSVPQFTALDTYLSPSAWLLNQHRNRHILNRLPTLLGLLGCL